MLKLRYIAFFALALVIVVCGKSKKQKTSVPAKIQTAKAPAKFAFDQEIYNFGSLKNNVKVSYTFAFKNKGEQNLVIADVDEGCSCTKVTWPQKPIKPGETEYIEVILDTHGQSGNLYRTVTLFSNAMTAQKELIITAFIQ